MNRRLTLYALGTALAASACASEKFGEEEVLRTCEGMGTAGSTNMRTSGQAVADFKVDAVYTDDHGAALGTRWVHKVHGMPVIVLHIQSVPQVFLAFNTPAVSDRGEPHTGEHLLLGKGTKGKMLSAEQEMSLVDSTAWTAQSDVCYSWSCGAGKETFYRSVEQYLDALLLPDYSDEEVRREVCHIGPVKDERTGRLSVDEKGSIYQEMVSTCEKRWNVWDELVPRLWGEGHPLACNQGGEPAAVRTCEPHHVHEFHAAHYHLGADTQMIVSLPDSVPEEEFLAKLSAQMADVDARPEVKARGKTIHTIPPGRPSVDRSLLTVPYPNANEDDGGLALVAWPPVPLASQANRVACELFLSTLGNGETATLYKRLMDSATREVAADAADMGASLDASKIDLVPSVWFDQISPRSATKERMAEIVGVIRNEIARVAALAAGSPELAAFNAKALVKLTEREKGLKKQLNAPPLFGHRGAGGFWLDHLRLLDQAGGFQRSVTLAPVFTGLRAEIAAGRNPWAHIVEAFGLRGEPFSAVSVASKAELEKRTAEHAQRVEGYVAEIAKRFGLPEQEALAKFKAEYDGKTAALDELEKKLSKPHLVADVPLTPDPSIKLEPVTAGGVKGFRGVFDNMTFVETSLSFRAVATDADLPWLAILPQFLTESGVVVDGTPVPYDKASEQRSKEIYALSANWSMRPSRGRHELRVTASGVDDAEAKRAIDWMELCLRHAWIAPENLPRLRDLVGQEIQATRGRLGGAEENWVNDPAAAVRWQADPVFLSTSSIHARLFQLARCEWRLMDTPTGEDAATVRRQLDAIASLGASGGDVKSVADGLGLWIEGWRKTAAGATAKWVVPIASRIKEMAGDMAPSTIAKDLRTLTDTCWDDLRVGPSQALADVRNLITLTTVPRGDSTRFALTGSRAHTDEVLPRLAALAGTLGADSVDAERGTPTAVPVVDSRLRDHEPGSARPLFYGLVHNAGTSGVFLLSAKAAGYDDLDVPTLAGELASRVFGGSGPHAFFMKTWGAGLAYSNGLSVRADEGRVSYYAERCPDLVQTMSFVAGLVKDAGRLDDPYLVEYGVANAVTWSRESDEFESRTRAAADEWADGDTPERVARWRAAVLAMRSRPDAWTLMRPQVVPMTGRVIPGTGPRARDVEGAVFLTIAPEPLLARWEKYVQDREGADERVCRIYGRDFWLVR